MKRRSLQRLSLLVVCSALTLAAADHEGEPLVLEAPDGAQVTIQRDAYGVPHIEGETELALFYGQGFAAARDRLVQMEIFRRTALGRLSEVGLGTVEQDRQVRTVFYTEAEREAQFAALSDEVQDVIRGYAAGINAYLDLMDEDPSAYKPREFFALPVPEPWTSADVVAVTQLIWRRFGAYGGQELDRCTELRTFGPEWFERNRPLNDPDVPTTILGGPPPEPPSFAFSGVAQCPSLSPSSSPSSSRIMQSTPEGVDDLIPPKLGSFAVVLSGDKTSTGNVMLLGAPQLRTPEGRPVPLLDEPYDATDVSFVHEVELQSPALHVGGLAIAGIPGVLQGRSETFAWATTSGRSDNQDVYIERINAAFQYWYDGAWRDFEVITEPDLGGYTHFRTVHGPVVGQNPAVGEVFALKMAFWNRELDASEALYDLWTAKSLEDVEAAVAQLPISANVFYIDREQRARFWHAGLLPDRRGGVDPRLPHLGDGSQEWRGFIPFEDLPHSSGQSSYENWNNKPVRWWNNGDPVPWARTPDEEGDRREAEALRVLRIMDYVQPIPSMTFEQLKSVPQQINDNGTYQQATELPPSGRGREENIVPPGQSGFISAAGVPSPHFDDQWALHLAGLYKDMLFGEPVEDETVPACEITDVRSGPPSQMDVRVQDVGSGLVAINVLKIENATLTGHTGFAAGTREAVVVQATKDDESRKATVVLEVIDRAGNRRTCDPVVTTLSAEVPETSVLEQNYPNPFNPATTIRFRLAEPTRARLEIYDLLGRRVARLVDEPLEAGSYGVVWNGEDNTGRPVAGGFYLYRLKAGSFTGSKTMTLLK